MKMAVREFNFASGIGITLTLFLLVLTTEGYAQINITVQRDSAETSVDIRLTTQDDVDDFGALGWTEVTGDLIIIDSCCTPKITDLKPLRHLTAVGGMCKVSAVTLTSLDGLSHITTVGYLCIEGFAGRRK